MVLRLLGLRPEAVPQPLKKQLYLKVSRRYFLSKVQVLVPIDLFDFFRVINISPLLSKNSSVHCCGDNNGDKRAKEKFVEVHFVICC